MPNWQPNWENVRWDHGAAHAAVVALRRAAELLENAVAQKERAANEARAQWRGRYRDEFEERFSRLRNRARELSEQYRHAANQILRASEWAREEQRRREWDRARWWAEKEAEEAARRAGLK